MRRLNIFCFGFGQVAKNFIYKLQENKINFYLSSTTREKTDEKKIKDIHYKNFNFSENDYDKTLIEDLEKADYILISIPPVGGKDIVLKNLGKIFQKYKSKKITYLSATSVYGNHKGEWVDEKSETKPNSKNGIERLNAENSWMEMHKKYNLSVQILRLSGIYSNQFSILHRLKSGEAKIIKKENHFFSRIHTEDIANVLYKSLANFRGGEIYNISDDKPASSEEVLMYGVKLLGIEKPKTVELVKLENKMLKNFYKDSKKVSNKKMKEFFNLKLKYPTYIEGLDYIFDNYF
tara:strand:+ start:144 stop:1019 length:876 start_codon:yes stop_codon:yes gene_type:complete